MQNTSLPVPEHWLYWSLRHPEWLQQPFISVEGHTIELWHPGEINPTDGPDFVHARMVINGIRYGGDIECHITAREWYRHGHEGDPRYQRVILHVLWEADPPPPTALSARFPHVVLRDHLRLSLGEWRRQMLKWETSFPEITPGSPPPPENEFQLSSLAEERFARKQIRLKRWLRLFSFPDVLMIVIAEALGYRHNQFPFRQLLWDVPGSTRELLWQRLHLSPLAIWVWLALRANLLNTVLINRYREAEDAAARQVLRWWQIFRERGECPVLALSDWHFSRVRPHNHPLARLAGLAQLLFQYSTSALFRELLADALSRQPLHTLLPRWIRRLHIPLSPQLMTALRLSGAISRPPVHAMGLTRIKQFLMNGLLPLLCLWADKSGSPGFRYYLEGIYESFPACEDEGFIQASLPRSLSVRQNALLSRSGYYQQGLLEWLSRGQQKPPGLFDVPPSSRGEAEICFHPEKQKRI